MFRQWLFENELMRPYLGAMLDDLTRISDLGILADYLDEHDPQAADIASLLRAAVHYYREKPLERIENKTLDRAQTLLNQHEDRLRLQGYHIVPHANEIYHQPSGTHYYWNGNNIRVQVNYQRPQTIQLSQIEDPLTIEAFAVMLASKAIGASHETVGLRPRRGAKGQKTQQTWDDEQKAFDHKEDTLLRSYLSRFLFAFSQAENHLSDTLRLQRNQRAIRELNSSLTFINDPPAIMLTIARHLKLHPSPFLLELADRIHTFLENLERIPPVQRERNDPRRTPLIPALRRIERLIRELSARHHPKS